MIEVDYGFVLKRYPFRETSLIANFYTLRFGKITGILKGFYTLKKEFTSSLDVFTLNEFTFYPKTSQIWLVSFADLVCDYPSLRRNLSKAKAAAIFFRLLDKVMQPWDKNADVFYLIKESLLSLEREDEAKATCIFLIKFLNFCGFKPEFNRCLTCQKKLEKEIFFSASKGGLVCKSCHRFLNDSQKISKQMVSSLLYIQGSNFPQVYRLNLAFDCARDILCILRGFLLYHLDFDIYHPSATKITLNKLAQLSVHGETSEPYLRH